MNISEGEIAGVQHFSSKSAEDLRGSFHKLYSSEWGSHPLMTTQEIFYSDSRSGVLRGMHLQIRESLNDRIISVLSGKIFDVLLDLRVDSPTFLSYQISELSADHMTTIYVPAGVAHGFQALEQSRTLYSSSKSHNPLNDVGVNALSLGIDWPIKPEILSLRDANLPSISEWLNQF